MAADLHKKSNNDGILSAKAKTVRLFLFMAAIVLIACMIFCLAACNENGEVADDGGSGDDIVDSGGSDVDDEPEIPPQQEDDPSGLLQFEGVTLEDTSVMYDGEAHVIEPSGDIPVGTKISYSQKNCKDVGTYLIVVTLKLKGYQTLELRATLTIVPAHVEVEFADREFVWDGNPHDLYVVGALPEGSTVTYEGNGRVEVGTYVVTAHIEMNKNYEKIEDLHATLTIKEREYVIKFIHWDDEVEERRVLRGGSLPEDQIPANKEKDGYHSMIWDPEWLAKTKNVQSDFYVREIEGELKVYTATLNPNGGMLELNNGSWGGKGEYKDGKWIIKYTVEDNITLAEARMPDHKFEGWYDDATGNRVTKLPDGEPRDISLTAQWYPAYPPQNASASAASREWQSSADAQINASASLPYALFSDAVICLTRKKFAFERVM